MNEEAIRAEVLRLLDSLDAKFLGRVDSPDAEQDAFEAECRRLAEEVAASGDVAGWEAGMRDAVIGMLVRQTVAGFGRSKA